MAVVDIVSWLHTLLMSREIFMFWGRKLSGLFYLQYKYIHSFCFWDINVPPCLFYYSVTSCMWSISFLILYCCMLLQDKTWKTTNPYFIHVSRSWSHGQRGYANICVNFSWIYRLSLQEEKASFLSETISIHWLSKYFIRLKWNFGRIMVWRLSVR